MTFFVIVSCVAFILAFAAFLTSLAAFVRTNDCLKTGEDIAKVGADLAPVKERLAGLDDSAIRAVMEKGGDASVEAILQTAQRIMDMDPDESTTLDDAMKQSLEIHRRA